MGVGRAELLGGGGGPSSLRFFPGVGLGGGVTFCICIFGKGGGGRATWKPLWLHPWGARPPSLPPGTPLVCHLTLLCKQVLKVQ